MESGLEIFWYIIIMAAIASYAMLDGFDLGVGILHLFAKKDIERRIFLNAIGPVWDGNEVWLVILVGGLFAGFPYAYGTLLSGLYLPMVCLVCALIFRAVAIEFRSKHHSPLWRNTWDVMFFLGSLLIAFGIGVALGNLVHGIPLDANHHVHGDVFQAFFRPYPVLVGIFIVTLFMMHGAIYLVMKTEGELQEKLIAWVVPSIILFIMTYVVTTLVTLIYQEHMIETIRARPFLFGIVLLNILSVAAIPRYIHMAKYGFAFLASCANIIFLVVIYALGTFPVLIRSSIEPQQNSLTVHNSAASPSTLTVLSVIVAIGLPLVAAYAVYVYHTFRGKVSVEHLSY